MAMMWRRRRMIMNTEYNARPVDDEGKARAPARAVFSVY